MNGSSTSMDIAVDRFFRRIGTEEAMCYVRVLVEGTDLSEAAP